MRLPEMNSLSSLMAILLVVTWLLISIGTVTLGGFVLGAVMALIGAVVLFYVLFRLDKWAKGL